MGGLLSFGVFVTRSVTHDATHDDRQCKRHQPLPIFVPHYKRVQGIFPRARGGADPR